MLSDFANVGRDLFLSGAITSHGGNLSQSDGKTIWITRTGSQLGRLKEGDVIATTWEPSELDNNCSSELVVHRELYHAWARRCESAGAAFGKRAILHAHTLHTTLRSMYLEELEPLDSECKLLIPYAVQVVRPKESIGSSEAGKMLANLIERKQGIGVIAGHGPFAISESLAGALQIVSALEHTCELWDLVDQKSALGWKLA